MKATLQKGQLLGDNRSFDHLLRWILVMALIALGAVILWDFGFLSYLIENDVSGVSSLIIGLFVISSLYCLWHLFGLSRELSVIREFIHRTEQVGLADIDHSASDGPSRLARLLADIIQLRTISSETSTEILLQSFASDVRAPVRLGVFVSDVLYKLGLLGTVVGFILMLVSMRDLGEFDVETMRDALQNMTAGMAVALLTTLTGLSCGLLLRVQVNVLNSLALELQRDLVRVSNVILPVAIQRNRSDV